MDLNKYQSLWNQTKEKLSETLDEDAFAYFSEISVVSSFSNGHIHVLAPTISTVKRINTIYSNKIQDILNSLTDEKLKFKFVTSEEEVKVNKVITPEPEKKSGFQYKLNANYTFDSFVVGESNKIAFRTARQVAIDGVFIANPLYIFGGVGLGKTHLMQAIGNQIVEDDINKKVLYIFATDFIEDYTKACRTDSYDAFQEKYENLDVLLVDDIQMLSEGKKSQQEFFKLFNRMHTENKQIIITADKPADQLKDIMDRLTSRFNWGMAVDIKVPDLDHRIKILKRKLVENPNDKVVSDEVLKYIASNFSNNVRELESAIRKVISTSIVEQCDITLDLAREAIEPLIKNRKNYGSKDAYEDIKSIVADFYSITVSDLIGSKRKKEYITPRHICMYILKTKFELSYKAIGALMGGKDHTTVMAGVQKIDNEIESDSQMKMAVERILKKLEL